MSYLGRTTLKASDIQLKAATTISGSSTNTVVLTWTAPNEQSLIFRVNGVTQNTTDFTIAGSPTTITLASGNFADGSVVEVVGINDIGTTIVPADGSVTALKLADDSVTAAKLDTTGTPDGAKFLRDDMAWVVTGGAADAIYSSASEPVSPSAADVWFDTVNKLAKVYSGTRWDQMSNVFSATGGTETTYIDGGVNYKSHKFTASGTLSVTGSAGAVDYLIVGGGGSGGVGNHSAGASADAGGAGGAGAFYTATTVSLVAADYAVTVGDGGAAESTVNTAGAVGGNSVFNSITANGGGAGPQPNTVGGANGNSSGGGAGGGGSVVAGGAGGTYGNDGGASPGGAPYASAGGGGAGAVGGDNDGSGAGDGGVGSVNVFLDGTNNYYAGGGGGGAGGTGTRGSAHANGGGGDGGLGAVNGAAGTANTGGGGGGSSSQSTSSGAGGSGIVIIRYLI